MPQESKRTKMVHVYAPQPGAFRVEFVRPTMRTYDDGLEAEVPDSERRVLAEHDFVAGEKLPGGPVTISTYGELVDLLFACGDDAEKRDDARIEKQANEKRAMLERYLREKVGGRGAAAPAKGAS